MPKTSPSRVLVSFIGRGIPANRSNETTRSTHLGYRTTRYAFSAPEYASDATSLFGIALIHYLQQVKQTPIDRWLVLGSPQSNWDALLEAVPEAQWDNVLNEVYVQIREAVRSEEQQSTPDGKGDVTQELLNKWSVVLTGKLGSPQVECRLIGWSDSREHQMRMWRILNEHISEGAELVLDITHGFRHQPMLLATMVVLMSSLKQFKSVSFYYGAHDMSRRASTDSSENTPQDNIVPALKIDLFPELLEYIRRLGVLQVVGDYESLGKYILRDQHNMKQKIEVLAFKERANLDLPKTEVEELDKELDQWQPEDPVRETLKPMLLAELRKHHAATPWERAALRADEAIKHHDYLTAYTLLWEALVSLSVLIVCPEKQEQMDDLNTRKDCINALTRKLRSEHRKSFAEVIDAFRATRNWIVHGTPQNNERAREAIQSRDKLCNLFKEAQQVFSSLLAELNDTNAQGSDGIS